MSYAKALQVVVLISDHKFPQAVAEDEVRSQDHDRHHLTDYPRNCELHSIVNFIQTIVKFHFGSLGLCIANTSDCISVLVQKNGMYFRSHILQFLDFLSFHELSLFQFQKLAPHICWPLLLFRNCAIENSKKLYLHEKEIFTGLYLMEGILQNYQPVCGIGYSNTKSAIIVRYQLVRYLTQFKCFCCLKGLKR